MKAIIAAAAILAASPALATSPIDGSLPSNVVKFVRAIDGFSGTDIQFMSVENGQIVCAVYGTSDQFIATGLSFAQFGFINIQGITPDDVAGVYCRLTGLS